MSPTKNIRIRMRKYLTLEWLKTEQFTVARLWLTLCEVLKIVKFSIRCMALIWRGAESRMERKRKSGSLDLDIADKEKMDYSDKVKRKRKAD